MILTTLPRKLKERYPRLRVTCFSSGFNPVVFLGNPYVDGVDLVPRQLFGDDIHVGFGHAIQLKEQFFGVSVSDSPKPEIFLSNQEKRWADDFAGDVGPSQKPICVIHPFGKTYAKVLDLKFWEEMVKRWSHSVRFWQLGMAGQPAVTGCDRVLLGKRGFFNVRQELAFVGLARFFVGVDSAPMHIARSHGIKSLIATEVPDVKRLFERRREAPWFAKDLKQQVFLYEQNEHLEVLSLSPEERKRCVDRYFETGLKA
jgi:hypothetical protein